MNEALQQMGYSFDPENNIWIKSGYGGINYSDGDEVEDRIGSIIKRVNDISVLSSELRQHCTDWPSLYHLSSTRANILRPFEPELNGDILEIGAGCGAITRYLGECDAKVLALEGSPRRASIARSRTRDLENVTVLAEKFDAFKSSCQFDVITLIGVLEYANLFTSGENPALSMLRKVRSLLRPEGRLIIAIENQLGLKYFAGASEDHIGQPMYGIEGRYRHDQPQTFGRKVLADMLSKAGFVESEFLAPFPDYKLPVSVITESGFASDKFDEAALAWQSVRRDPQLPAHLVFSPELAWRTVASNGLSLDLSNSFLIVAGISPRPPIDPRVLAYHFSTDRAAKYCKQTQFLKKAGKQSVEVRYRSLARKAAENQDDRLIQFHLPEKENYVLGKPLSLEMIDILTQDDWRMEEVGNFLQRYLRIVEKTASSEGQAIRIESIDARLPGHCFDLIPQNIIVGPDGKLHAIDKEWLLTDGIPAGWLLFRSLLLLLDGLTRLGRTQSAFPKTRMGFIIEAFKAAGFDVNEIDIESYAKREAAVQEEVSGRPIESVKDFWCPNCSLPFENQNGLILNLRKRVESLAATNDKLESDYKKLDSDYKVLSSDYKKLSSNYDKLAREHHEKIAALTRALKDRSSQIDQILTSRSWRMTRPLRFLARILRGDWTTLKFGLHPHHHINHWGRTLFRHLPLPFNTKIWLMELAFKYAGGLFKGMGRYEVWKRTTGRHKLAGLHPSSVSNRDLKDSFETQYENQPISFPFITKPEVSVIIPVYRGLTDLQNCLRSLAAFQGTEPSFEVIVIDDCPEQRVLNLIPESGGLIRMDNAENLGFLLTCNRGATVARGRYLCFLNSDTIVTAGWLRPLIESLEEIPGAAMAGSMLLNRDGSIQDAGWRMMQNGWGYPIGRGDDPLNGAYTYRREVDCVTGACFLVSQKVFNELGGFDAAYAPAFYEEFDLAFRIRERGLKVIFEPRSRIVHLGSASYGAEQRDQLTKQNQAKFIERFADKLSKQPEEATDEFLLRKTFAKGPVILFVDLSVPHPDRHAGDVTMYRYLTLFAESGWHVIFSPFDGQADDSAAEALEKQGIELIRNPWSIEGWLPEQGKHLDFVWLSRPEIAETLIETIRAHSSARVYYYTHDLHYLRFEREAKLRGGNATLEAEAKRFFKLETGLFDRVDLVISPSEIENEVIKSLVPGKPVATLPPFFYEQHEIKVRNADHFAKYSDIVFIGGFPHTPNVDAALFIAREVMPIVWRDCPKARLILVGYKPPPEVQALAKARVVVTGQVPEVAPFLETARVFLAPLRFGAGVKGKIIQALQYGVPVVTSPIGIEGTSIQPGCEALVAVDAQGFAEAVISLLHDPDRCASLSAAGIELIGKKFSRNAAKSAIEQIFHMPRCGR